jgi:hypothetical protein
MVAKNREIILKSPLAREYAEWWSIWCDLLSARQALHDRNGIEATPSNMFSRRALWDGAVVAYCRCYKTGRQRAMLGKMLDGLTRSQRARHDEAMHWRDKHIAHRVDKKLETVMVVAIVDAADQVVEVEGRVTTSMFPAESAIAELAEVVNLLKDRVWEERLVPIKNSLVAESHANGN